MEKLGKKIEKLTDTAQEVISRLISLETHRADQEQRVNLFWSKDWPELKKDIRELLDRQRVIENNLSAVNAKIITFGAVFGFAAGFLSQIVNKLIK